MPGRCNLALSILPMRGANREAPTNRRTIDRSGRGSPSPWRVEPRFGADHIGSPEFWLTCTDATKKFKFVSSLEL